MLVKDGKWTLFRTITKGTAATAVGFCSGGEPWAQLQTQSRQVESIAKYQGRGEWMGSYSEETSEIKATLAKWT